MLARSIIEFRRCSQAARRETALAMAPVGNPNFSTVVSRMDKAFAYCSFVPAFNSRLANLGSRRPQDKDS